MILKSKGFLRNTGHWKKHGFETFFGFEKFRKGLTARFFFGKKTGCPSPATQPVFLPNQNGLSPDSPFLYQKKNGLSLDSPFFYRKKTGCHLFLAPGGCNGAKTRPLRYLNANWCSRTWLDVQP